MPEPENFHDLHRRSFPYAAIAAQDTQQTLTTSVGAIVIWETEIVDTDSAYDAATGIYTCPAPGVYQVSGQLRLVSNSDFVANELFMIRVYRNAGVVVALDWNDFLTGGGVNIQPYLNGTVMVVCDAGDTLDIRAQQNSGVNLNTDGNVNYNQASFLRLGPKSRT
jgi:hypothetical protein